MKTLTQDRSQAPAPRGATSSVLLVTALLYLIVVNTPARAQNPPRPPSETGQQRVTDAKGDKNEVDPQAALEAAIQAACQPAIANFPKALTVNAVAVPSNNQAGSVAVSWPAIAAADSSVRFLVAGVIHTGLGPDEQLEAQTVAHDKTSYVVSNLPPFFPARFTVTPVKEVATHLTITKGTTRLKAQLDTVLWCQASSGSSVAVTPKPLAMARPVWGFADTHTHQFADRAFGGQLVIGQAFGDPNQAFDGDYIGHGFILGAPIHATGGYPNFDGWPTWNIMVHQQMYSDWLYRAFLGGLRLMVTLGVNNETLCFANANQVAKDAGVGAAIGSYLPGIGTFIGGLVGGIVGNIESNGNVDCDDMDNVDAQISGAYEMESFLNNQCVDANGRAVQDPPRCPLPGKGWYHVVTSAQDARTTINSGRLAVVLGIEADRLFDCALTNKGDPRTGGHVCSTQEVHDQLDGYYQKGVRHIFPAHLANTAFSGMALYVEDPSWNYNNHFLNGEWIDASTDACQPHQGIAFNFNVGRKTVVNNLIALVAGLGLQGDPPVYPGTGHCNRMGLTDLGTSLVRDLMAHHMIIDVDHMSLRARDQTYALTGPACYPPTGSSASCYPVIAGHTGFLGAAATGGKQNENAKTDSDLAYIRTSGGVVAAGLNVGERASVKATNRVANDCSNSSKTWAQSYLYAVQLMGGTASAAVAVATDQPLNNFLGPRFGANGCSGDGVAQSEGSRLIYPITALTPGRHIKLDPSELGARKWDFNTDGMAHIGMYPDLIADLLNVGLNESDLQPLFRSAEQYIEMWEKAERLTPPPTPVPPSLPQLKAVACPTTDGVTCASGGAGGGNKAGAAMLKAKIVVTSGNAAVAGAFINISRKQLATTDANGVAVVTYPNCVESSPRPTADELVGETGGGDRDVRGHPIKVRHSVIGKPVGCFGLAHKPGFNTAAFRLP